MEPTLHAGDLAMLWAQGDYEIGDVVAYDFEGSYIIHRIVGVTNGGYVIRGDNKDHPDSMRPSKVDILGKMHLLLPGGGRIIVWVRQPITLGSIVGIAGVILMLTRPAFARGNGGAIKAEGRPHHFRGALLVTTPDLETGTGGTLVSFRNGACQSEVEARAKGPGGMGLVSPSISPPGLILWAEKMKGTLRLRHELPDGYQVFLVGRGSDLHLALLLDEQQ